MSDDDGLQERVARFRPYLQVLARLHWDRSLHSKMDTSDLVQQHCFGHMSHWISFEGRTMLKWRAGCERFLRGRCPKLHGITPGTSEASGARSRSSTLQRDCKSGSQVAMHPRLQVPNSMSCRCGSPKGLRVSPRLSGVPCCCNTGRDLRCQALVTAWESRRRWLACFVEVCMRCVANCRRVKTRSICALRSTAELETWAGWHSTDFEESVTCRF